jgi:hypothetical protein
MGFPRLLRTTLGAVAVSMVAGAALAGLTTLGGPAAQAATRQPGQAARPALHITGTVRLGTADSAFVEVTGEAPDGSVYYSLGGRRVYVVRPGSHQPALAVTASGTVLAVAANSNELFVAAGRTVTGYGRSSGRAEGQWRLPGLRPTQIGLYPVGGTVWAMTDWATDQSGFEYANVDRFTTTSSTVRTVSANDVYPGDMAADGNGLYYETENAAGTFGYLTRATPSGSVLRHRVPNAELDSPLALAGGRVILMAGNSNGQLYLESYYQRTLSGAYSRRVSPAGQDVAGTGAGLLFLTEPCQGTACPSAKVNLINAATGGTITSVTVPAALTLVPGPATDLITFKSKTFYLVRLAA